MNKYFPDLAEFKTFIEEKEEGHLVVGYFNLEGYAGMVLYIGIHFNINKLQFKLNLEWMSLGLDFYGDTLQESYMYKFDDLQKMTDYLQSKYKIHITNIPLKFEFDHSLFPNPVKNADQKSAYEEAWQQFQKDFKENAFLDNSLQLVYNSE